METAAGVNLKVEWGMAVHEPRTAFELPSKDWEGSLKQEYMS